MWWVWKMKKAYLIHGWGGGPESEGWFGWLKNELEKKGFEVNVPRMPNTESPKIKGWVNKLNEIVNPDVNTYFVGHSIGCQAILRYLEKLPEDKKIGGAVFVAGWFNLTKETYECKEDKEIARPWIETPIDLEKVKKHTKNFFAIFSNTDPYVPVSDSKIFKEKLGAKVIIKNNEEHFNLTEKIPEIINFIK